MKRRRLVGLGAMGLVCALAASAKAEPKGRGELLRNPVLMFEYQPTRWGAGERLVVIVSAKPITEDSGGRPLERS